MAKVNDLAWWQTWTLAAMDEPHQSQFRFRGSIPQLSWSLGHSKWQHRHEVNWILTSGLSDRVLGVPGIITTHPETERNTWKSLLSPTVLSRASWSATRCTTFLGPLAWDAPQTHGDKQFWTHLIHWQPLAPSENRHLGSRCQEIFIFCHLPEHNM